MFFFFWNMGYLMIFHPNQWYLIYWNVMINWLKLAGFPNIFWTNPNLVDKLPSKAWILWMEKSPAQDYLLPLIFWLEFESVECGIPSGGGMFESVALYWLEFINFILGVSEREGTHIAIPKQNMPIKWKIWEFEIRREPCIGYSLKMSIFPPVAQEWYRMI